MKKHKLSNQDGSVKKQSWASVVKNDFHYNKSLYLMILPVIAYYILFCYLPMYGAIIAFKNYQPYLGFLKSPFVGFSNFTQFFPHRISVRY